jgi:hypothetical protein
VEAAAPSFVVGEFWSTCMYDDQGQLVYNQVGAGCGILAAAPY